MDGILFHMDYYESSAEVLMGMKPVMNGMKYRLNEAW